MTRFFVPSLVVGSILFTACGENPSQTEQKLAAHAMTQTLLATKKPGSPITDLHRLGQCSRALICDLF
jgi:hypothetical protein